MVRCARILLANDLKYQETGLQCSKTQEANGMPTTGFQKTGLQCGPSLHKDHLKFLIRRLSSYHLIYLLAQFLHSSIAPIDIDPG